MKRDKDSGRFTRCYFPVAVRQVRKEKLPYTVVSNRDWYLAETLPPHAARSMANAAYDRDAMADVQKRGGIKALALRMFPHLGAERVLGKGGLVDRVQRIIHAKQRELERSEDVQRTSMKHNARRLTKAERRDKRKRKV